MSFRDIIQSSGFEGSYTKGYYIKYNSDGSVYNFGNKIDISAEGLSYQNFDSIGIASYYFRGNPFIGKGYSHILSIDYNISGNIIKTYEYIL